MLDDIERHFWQRVSKQENGCWLWTGTLNNKGYGSGYFGRHRSKLAHRYSYELRFGRIEYRAFCLHRCDTPHCVNPDHLFLGDQKANVADMWSKGRHSPPPRNDGEKRANAKLTNALVKSYRERFTAGESLSSLAREAKIDRATMRDALRGDQWQEAGGPLAKPIRNASEIYIGAKHPNSKLTVDIVREARTRRAAGEPYYILAKAYGVNRAVITDAIKGVTWKHVT